MKTFVGPRLREEEALADNAEHCGLMKDKKGHKIRVTSFIAKKRQEKKEGK